MEGTLGGRFKNANNYMLAPLCGFGKPYPSHTAAPTGAKGGKPCSGTAHALSSADSTMVQVLTITISAM